MRFAQSLALFGTLEAGLGYFVYSQWKKPRLVPLPSRADATVADRASAA